MKYLLLIFILSGCTLPSVDRVHRKYFECIDHYYQKGMSTDDAKSICGQVFDL